MQRHTVKSTNEVRHSEHTDTSTLVIHCIGYSVSEMKSLKQTEGLTTRRLCNQAIEGNCPAKLGENITTTPNLVCSS